MHITNTGIAGNVPVQPAEGGGGVDCAEGGGDDESEVMANGHRSDIHHTVTHWNKNAIFSEPENQEVNMKSAWIWIFTNIYSMPVQNAPGSVFHILVPGQCGVHPLKHDLQVGNHWTSHGESLESEGAAFHQQR